MERGLFIAASGMLAAQIRQDVIANNLANATNPGFKGEVLSQVAFGDMLLSNTQTGAPIGPLNTGTLITSIKPNLSNNGFRWTQNTLDMAIGGTGFFAIQTDQGVQYTRNGAFTTDAQGFLITAQGDKVLGKDGQPLDLSGGGRISIARTGEIHVGDRLAGTVGVVALDPDSLRKAGRQLPDGHRRRERQGRRRRAGRARDFQRQHGLGDGRADREHARVRGRPEGDPGAGRHARRRRNQVGRV